MLKGHTTYTGDERGHELEKQPTTFQGSHCRGVNHCGKLRESTQSKQMLKADFPWDIRTRNDSFHP